MKRLAKRTYEFTPDEQEILREALLEYKHFLKGSRTAIQRFEKVSEMHKQVQQDYMLCR